MKSVLYAGAALMIGASIYGVVDMSNKSRKKEFTNLYKEETVKAPVTDAGKNTGQSNASGDKTLSQATEKKTADKAQAGKGTASTKSAPATKQEKNSTVNNGDNVFVGENLDPSNDVDRKLLKKRKKLSAKLFSRAPIREEEINFVSEPEKPVKDTKKETTKEQ